MPSERRCPCRIDAEVFWRRDGSAFAVEYSSYPILDGAQVRGAVVTFVDITARRADAQALYKAKEELEQRVSERTAELSAALGQLRELAAWSEEVREDERTRIAREVHDELGSLLVALKMDVNWLDKRLGEQEARTREAAQDMRQRMRGKCQNMSRLIETAVDNVGRIITDLRPSILDHQGLWAALEWQAHDLLPAAELALDWQMALPDGLELPEAEAMAVFRIFQEMLSNVVRHAAGRWCHGPDRGRRRAAEPLGARRRSRRTAPGVRGARCLWRDGHARAGAPFWRTPGNPEPRGTGNPVQPVLALACCGLCLMIRVLLCDDHRIVREGLKQVLADAPDNRSLRRGPHRHRGARAGQRFDRYGPDPNAWRRPGCRAAGHRHARARRARRSAGLAA